MSGRASERSRAGSVGAAIAEYIAGGRRAG